IGFWCPEPSGSIIVIMSELSFTEMDRRNSEASTESQGSDRGELCIERLRNKLTDEDAARLRDALRLLEDSRRGIDSLIEEFAWTPKERGYAFQNFVEVKRTREPGIYSHR